MKQNDVPAFPVILDSKDSEGKPLIIIQKGMTLRDWFAATANKEDIEFQKLILDAIGMISTPPACRYAHADAMLAERAK